MKVLIGLVFSIVLASNSFAYTNQELEQSCIDFKSFNNYSDFLLHRVYVCTKESKLSEDECLDKVTNMYAAPSITKPVDEMIHVFERFMEVGDYESCTIKHAKW